MQIFCYFITSIQVCQVAAGWQAQTEVAGYPSDREKWTVDVLARKGEEKVAVRLRRNGDSSYLDLLFQVPRPRQVESQLHAQPGFGG